MKNALTIFALYVMTVVIFAFIQFAYLPGLFATMADQGGEIPGFTLMLLRFNEGFYLRFGVLYLLGTALFCIGLFVLLLKFRTKRWPLLLVLVLTAIQMVLNLVFFTVV